MALSKRTTKQIAQKYKGNLDYLRKPHVFRMAKLVLFLLAVVGSVALAFGHYHPTAFSTGPICANHQRFADRCEVCHEDAKPDLWNAFSSTRTGTDGKVVSVSMADRLKTTWVAVTRQMEAHDGKGAVTAASSLAKLDHACLKCHEPMKLHQPQVLSLGLRPVRAEISAAEVASCSSCHREHQGPEKMKDPPSSNCVDCHGNPERLRETLVTYQIRGGHPPPSTGAVQDFKFDGVRRFVPPRESPHQPVAFTRFDQGHPAFGYEQPGMRDPAALAYNHSRHEQKDIPPVNGHKLACTDCHKPGADGMFMQRVTYQQQCSGCHSLHFFSDLPTLTIPHRDPQRVRDTLTSAGLTVLFQDYAVKEKKLLDRPAQEVFITEQFKKLNDRGIGSTDALLARVFRLGDPPNTTNQFFPACTKCHVLNTPQGNATPTVTPTNSADRWLVRGPFNHAPHAHMACIDCHGAALTSTKTTDILLTPQRLCAECHRPLVGGDEKIPFQKVESYKLNPVLTAQQRDQGGVSYGCQYCHPRYHAPADATVFAKQAVKIPAAPARVEKPATR